LSLGHHSDDAGWSRHLEPEVGIAKNSHEFDVAWMPQDDVKWPREVDHIKGEHLSAVVACVSEGDRQSNLPEEDELLAREHYVEWVQAIFELVPGQLQPLKCVKLHEVETTTPIHEGFSESSRSAY
jgi:hypothetical protein